MTPETNLLEIVLRVVVVYVSLSVLLRLGGKRQFGELTPLDFLTVLLLSETVSPALTRQDTSLHAALVAAGTLVGLTILVDRLTFRFRRLERVIEGKAAILVRDGKVLEAVRRREHITMDEIQSALREHGVEDVQEVRRAYVEPRGGITVLKRGGAS
jgi:uncharacterized membrane protein YcaP (DUF421 family)